MNLDAFRRAHAAATAAGLRQLTPQQCDDAARRTAAVARAALADKRDFEFDLGVVADDAERLRQNLASGVLALDDVDGFLR